MQGMVDRRETVTLMFSLSKSFVTPNAYTELPIFFLTCF